MKMKRLVKVVMFLALAAFICFPVNQASALTNPNALLLTSMAGENDPFFAAWDGMSVFRVRNTYVAGVNDADLNVSLYFNGDGSTQSFVAYNGPTWNYVDPYVAGGAFGDTFVAFSAFPGTGIVTFYDNAGASIASFTKAAAQFDYTGPTPSVPEPATMLLLGLGLVGLAGARRKFKG